MIGGTPWRAFSRWRSSSGSSSHSPGHAHTLNGPYVSVSPYTCTMRAPSASMRAITVGEGGAPAVVTVSGRSSGAASGCE